MFHIRRRSMQMLKGSHVLNNLTTSGPSMRPLPQPLVKVRKFGIDSARQDVVIALGSNVGDRVENFNMALKLMRKSGVDITRHGCMYESSPAYVTDQPNFLNSAVRGTTELGPHELLGALKQIERELGRTEGIRYGPRPIDLDILFYGAMPVASASLIVPHERIGERPFVVAPLVDLLGSSEFSGVEAIWHDFFEDDNGLFGLWRKLGGEPCIGGVNLRRVMPVNGTLWEWSKQTHVMGVLNLTPDSFSDGGKYLHLDAVASRIRALVSSGADIIDIGAQSTRPNATKVSAEEELRRLMPILDMVHRIPEIMEGKFLSVDTFYAKVASEAVKRGVHIVNDVSGGQLDPDMLAVVGELGVPFVAMHMRGDPSTMQSTANSSYSDVCSDVASELCMRICEAEASGIPLWRIIIDPGIGFSKNQEQNLEILAGLQRIRGEIRRRHVGAAYIPLLIGASRKQFLGEICGHDDPAERDAATVAASAIGITGGANIIRVHNVSFGSDTARVSDALLGRKKWDSSS